MAKFFAYGGEPVSGKLPGSAPTHRTLSELWDRVLLKELRFPAPRNKVMDASSDTGSGPRSLPMENTVTAVLETPLDLLLCH